MNRILPLVALLCLGVPAYGSQLVEDLVNVRFQIDTRVFAVMAAANAAGFDLGAEDLSANPARRILRERLSGIDPELKERLRRFLTTHEVELDPLAQQSKFVSLSLFLEGPPRFALTVQPEHLPRQVHPIVGFEPLVAELWEKANLAKVWEEIRPYYNKEAEGIRPHLRQLILEALKYFRTEARIALDRQVVVIPDLLNGFGVVNARNLEKSYVLLVGPSRTGAPAIAPLRHEYLHFMVDPLIAKYAGHFPEPEPFLAAVRQRPRALERYKNDFSLMATESLIRMIELQIETPPDMRQAGIVDRYDEGLILAPYFNSALELFSRSQGSLIEFLPEYLTKIQWETEKGRSDQMTKGRTDRQTTRPTAQTLRAPAVAQPADPLRQSLEEANRLLQAGDFDKAEVVLTSVLERNPTQPSALFGMAQVAARAEDFARALSLYQDAAANSGSEIWIAGWARVRRGRIFAFQDDERSAREEWNQVLGLQGDLRGAREAAREALQALERKSPPN